MIKKIVSLALCVCMARLAGCVDQHPEESKSADSTTAAENVRLIATSPAVADICDKLELDLVGLPGSYIIATESSYVGSLVMLAGGENVYGDGDGKEFLNVNTEDMKLKEPDVILRCAHALPEDVVEMFNEEFRTNDIWKHFDAVANGRVYDLSYEYFGMSANFSYPQALEELQPLLYPEG